MDAKDERIKELEEENRRLQDRVNEDNSVCICGCPIGDHENYGEDGESCEHEDHECHRTFPAALAIVTALRGQVEELKKERDALGRKLEEIERNYSDLILFVETKCPGESRHETARRYIQNAEHFGGIDGIEAKVLEEPK